MPWALEGLSPDRLTERLRSVTPDPGVVPVPVAAGPVVALSTSTLRLLPRAWDAGATSWVELAAVYSLSLQARGLFNAVDMATYVHRAADLRPLAEIDATASERLRRRFPWYEGAIELAIADRESPLQLDVRLAHAKVAGLDVLLDGTCLGPMQMGTQVGVVSVCRALCARDDVRSVALAVRGPLPGYAQPLAALSKVTLIRTRGDTELETSGRFDVAFRAFQPDVDYHPSALRAYADRLVVSILDLIAYQNGSYHPSLEGWRRYRRAITTSVASVDAVTTISRDVVSVVRMERLPVDDERLHPVPYGTEHVDDAAPKSMPAALAREPHLRFLVCLGTNYGHKNRDLAIRCVQELRRRGRDLRLVLAGPTVPSGSSRLLEAEALLDGHADGLVTLADVTTAERNWLFAHAECIVYPTSAEGFGLVPYEAAWLGTPTVFVPFGPLAEIAGSLPGLAADWSPAAFADAVEAHLDDPAMSAEQVRRLRSASDSTSWAATAAALCDVFRATMAMAPVG